MRIRYSLKTLILACTVIAIASAVWIQNLQTIHDRESIRKHGCECYYDYVRPWYLQHVFGYHFVVSVTHVNLAQLEMKPHAMRPQMVDAEITPEMLDTISQLPNLRVVWIHDDSPGRHRFQLTKNALTRATVVNLFDSQASSRPLESAGDFQYGILQSFPP